jgi:hypothetical protein
VQASHALESVTPPNGTFQGGFWLDTAQRGSDRACRTIAHRTTPSVDLSSARGAIPEIVRMRMMRDVF